MSIPSLKAYKLSGAGPEYNYTNAPSGFTEQKVLNINNMPFIYQDLPKPMGLPINTMGRAPTQRVLPADPPSYLYNYGFSTRPPIVNNTFGMVPTIIGKGLSKIGKEDYPILAPPNLYVNLKMGC